MRRSLAIPKSSLHEIHRLVGEHGEAVPLHVGEPYLRMPASAEEAMVRALRDGRTEYTDAPGLPELRDALRSRLARSGTRSVEVFATPGSCQALAAVLLSVGVDGGSVLLPDVHWPTHRQQVALAGMAPRFYDLELLATDPRRALEEAWVPGTCAVLTNSPSNPSGRVLDEPTMAAVHAWAVERQLPLLSDEAYEDFVFEGVVPTFGALDATVPPERRVVFSIHSFSKGFSMTGCRLGYVGAPTAESAELLRRVQEACLIAPSTPVQLAGLAALDDDTHLRTHHDYVRATRDEVLARLRGTGLIAAVPQGGWYLLLDVSQYGVGDRRLCADLLASTGVALAPGHSFVPAGDRRDRSLVRLAFSGERETTVAAVDRVVAQLESRLAAAP